MSRVDSVIATGRAGASAPLALVGWILSSLGGAVAPAPVGAQVVDTLQVIDTLQVADTIGTDSLALAADSVPPPGAYDAPIPEGAATHLDHITSAYPDAPGGMGLVPAGMAEAEIAAEHVRLAGRDSTNLSNMVRHIAHVLHAIDPAEVGQGPGMGYGFKRAAEGVLTHLELAMASGEELPGVLELHAPYVERAARGASARADQAIELARGIQRASSAREANRLVRQLDHVVRAMAYGDDRDGDGRIGYTEAESGLAQVEYHLTLVRRVTDPLR